MPRLPSSADVQRVSPRIAADPGVRAPVQAFESPLGIVAEEAAPAAARLGEIALRQENRRDTVDRADKINRYNRERDERLRQLEVESDLSDEKVLADYGRFLSQRRQELLQEHQGSEDSKALLGIRLQDQEADAIGRAAGISTRIGRDKALTQYNATLAPSIARISANPTVRQVNQEFLNLETSIGDIRGAFDPKDENTLRRVGQESFALSAIDTLLTAGRIDEAEALMVEGNLGAHMSADVQRQTINKIQSAIASRDEKLREISLAGSLAAAKEAGEISAIEQKLERKLTETELLRRANLAPSALKTKEVFNLKTNRLEFASEEEIAANPNLLPKEVGLPEEDKITSAQRLAAGFGLRAEQASQVVDEIGAKFTGLEARAGERLPQGLKSADRQRFEQAQRNFTNAVLRRESGAAIAPSEFESAEQQYFPRPGDSAAVLTQKSQNRVVVVQALKLEAGPAFEQLAATVPSTVMVRGKPMLVGSTVTNSKGKKGRVEQDGSITILGEAKK